MIFALAAILPMSLGLLVQTKWASGIASRETRKVLAGFGVDARFDVGVGLWPLSVSLRNIRVEATDQGGPFLTADRVTVRPRLFGLIAGKLIIDEIDVERPRARVVLDDGKLANLHLDLPESKDQAPMKRLPFSVISASEADLDLTVDGKHASAHDIDLDVTSDDAFAGGIAVEVAVHVGQAKGSFVRALQGPEPSKSADAPVDYAVDEDVLCGIDGRARIEPTRVFVRRFSATGAVDLDPTQDSSPGCELPKTDKRYLEVELGHLDVAFPKPGESFPNVDGHAKVRLPLPVLDRLAGVPELDGWGSVDADFHYTKDTVIPDLTAHIEAGGIRLDHYSFARSIVTDVKVQKGVVTSPNLRVEIAEGVADIHDVEVRPFEKGIPMKASLDAHGVSFVALMRDLGVAKDPHVNWDLREVHGTNVHGTLDPLRLDGDFSAHTTDFAVYDAPVDSPARTRAIGVSEGNIRGKVAIRSTALEFNGCTVTTPHSVINGVSVSIGFQEVLRVDVADAKVDLADISPIGNVVMSGVAQAKATVAGPFGNPHIEADVSIQDYTLGAKPNDLNFGNITQGHVVVDDVGKKAVNLVDVRAQKGKSNYELSTGRLDFGGDASMRLDGQVSSKNLDVRDFFSIFKLDDDPRFEEIEGTLETSTRVHFVLGGPEDVCKAGFLDVSSSTTARNVNLMGEHFDEGHAEFEYRWIDRMAGVEGAEIDVRSLALSKVKKRDGATTGSVLGSVFVQRGGLLRGSLVVQGFPLARTDMLGATAEQVEGSASGVARVGGTLSAFDVEADVNLTPMRLFGASFGSSDVHVRMVQYPQPAKVVGTTYCKAPITAPFDKEAYLRDTSAHGAFTVDGSLFGGQVKLEDVVVTRQKTPAVSGRIALSHFDLGPLGKAASRHDQDAQGSAAPSTGTADETNSIGGEITAELVIDHLSTGDLAHAQGRFAPKAIRVTRGGQTLTWRPQPVVALLENNTITIPYSTFDIATTQGLKGAFTIDGSVKNLTQGADLALDAELSPIDLGVLVGSVPRLSHALGTLRGSVRLGGKVASPKFDGELSIRGGEFGFKGLAGNVSNVDVDVSADENEARITRATGKLLGGDVSVTARIPIRGGQLGVGEAVVTARQLSLSPMEGVKATGDADLRITMNPEAATAAGRLPLVTGDVSITSFEATKPFTLNLTDLRGGAKRTVIESYDPSLDSLAFDFDVHARAPLRIRNNLVEAQLAIDPRGIRVSGTNQRIGLRGEVTAMSGGRFRLFANDFDIQKATIQFDDPTRIAPHVDVLAVTEYRRYSNTSMASASPGAATGSISSGGSGGNIWRITLHAYGDLEELNVDMSSDPSLSREDIFLLLTVGLTRAELDQVRSGSVYTSAAIEALGTVSGVDRAVKQAIPVIDDFRAGTAYSPRTGRVEPNITVGRRIAENIRARLTSGLAEDPQLRSTIEWRLNRAMTVEPSYDRTNTVSASNIGNFGLDFRWRVEFN